MIDSSSVGTVYAGRELVVEVLVVVVMVMEKEDLLRTSLRMM